MLMVIAVTGCDDDNSRGQDTICTLSSFSITYEDKNSVTKSFKEATYDAMGNQTTSVANYTTTNTVDGSINTQKVVTTNDYDADGFLLYRTAEYTNKPVNGIVASVKETSDYSYDDGRLVKIDFIRAYTDSSPNINTAIYEYDIEGKVIRYETNDSWLSIEYDGIGFPSKITQLNVPGPARVYTGEYNSVGFMSRISVTESDGSISEYRYKFEEVGQVTHLEHPCQR